MVEPTVNVQNAMMENQNADSLSSKLDLLLSRSNSTEKKIDGLNAQITDIKKTVDQFDGRFAAIEKRTQENENKLLKFDDRVTAIDTKVVDCVESTKFVSDQYDGLKTTVEGYKLKLDQLSSQFSSLDKENVNLKAGINDTLNQLEQEKSGRNQDAQYLRTSLNLKLCGLPLQPGEDIRTETPSNPVTLALINRVCDTANISMLPNAIDVCHRLGFERRSPIIIRFTSKSSRFQFHSQRSKLVNISTQNVDYTNLPKVTVTEKPNTRGGGASRGSRGAAHAGDTRVNPNAIEGETEKHNIYVQEHLTKYNKDLLKEAKEVFGELDFEYPGYAKDGEVRVKQKTDSKPHIIRCRTDIKRLKDAASSS